MHILVIEDNKKLGDSIIRGLRQEGYAADHVLDGREGEERLLRNQSDYTLLILDLTLPGKHGIDVCLSLRAKGVVIPIIMLTAKDTISDKILGLDSGADDYLVKPFSFEELVSRVRALSRRNKTTLSPEIHIGDIVLKSSTQEVYVQGKLLDLTLKEFRIMEYFMTHQDQVITRQKIVDHLWDFNFNPLSRAMDVHINHVRNKLKQHNVTNLETVRGIGYRLRS
jgi:DNA-binding response OmpR family regulator